LFQAQELWLACTALLEAVSSGANPSGLELRCLGPEIKALESAAAPASVPEAADPFVREMLASIPEEAGTRGIFTEDSIRERFRRVEKLARRTAMIGQEGGSLMRYALSYLQSLLILSPPMDEPPPPKESPVDVDALDTFDLVWLARAHIERGDLDQAVRYIGLLRGEPGNVARDWLREARLLLETRQACQALMAHAAAVGVEALPPSPVQR
jgi:mitofilin